MKMFNEKRVELKRELNRTIYGSIHCDELLVELWFRCRPRCRRERNANEDTTRERFENLGNLRFNGY